MSRIKTAKKPKPPKAAKKLTRNERHTLKEAERIMKAARKISERRRKRLDIILGVTAVTMSIISAVLDLLISIRHKA